MKINYGRHFVSIKSTTLRKYGLITKHKILEDFYGE